LRTHPYNAPFITNYKKPLNIDLMKKAAKLFEGIHNFKRYASNPSENTLFEREILKSEVVTYDRLKADFVPTNAFVFKVKSRGFLTYQVRLMMGAMVNVGDGSWTLEDFKETLSNPEGRQVKNIAPSSGLCLHRVEF
jgi:tRNA pseudouridine38-40 synthase